jgi:YggT family protein
MAKTSQEVVRTSTSRLSQVPGPSPMQETPPAAMTERTEEVTVDPYEGRREVAWRLEQVVWLICGVVEGMIAIRFVLRLFGANPAAAFARLIYRLTAPLLAPFAGLFPSPRFEGNVLEVTSVVALIVYLLLAWLVVELISVVFREDRTGSVTRRTETRIQ